MITQKHSSWNVSKYSFHFKLARTIHNFLYLVEQGNPQNCSFFATIPHISTETDLQG